MLMQNFKSAADLGITEPQLSALQKTLVLLETGKLMHRPVERCLVDWSPAYSSNFNMRHWHVVGPCGTIACIGGTAELIGNVKFPNQSRGLRNLFMPAIEAWENITPAQAATALRSYLTTGDARWDLAVAS